jgi:hypothetical protein
VGDRVLPLKPDAHVVAYIRVEVTFRLMRKHDEQ